jgi:hypothetical protein
MRTSQSRAPIPERYVRVEPAAAAVQRSTYTVRNLLKSGKVPALRSGNLLLVDLQALQAHYAPRPAR